MPTPPPTESTPFLPKTHSHAQPSNYNHDKETAPEVISAQNGVKNGQTSGEDLPDQAEKAATSTVTKTVSVYLQTYPPCFLFPQEWVWWEEGEAWYIHQCSKLDSDKGLRTGVVMGNACHKNG